MLASLRWARHGRKFFDQLVHANWSCAKACDIYYAPPLHYLGGEPIFIADPRHEAAGVVILPDFQCEPSVERVYDFNAFR